MRVFENYPFRFQRIVVAISIFALAALVPAPQVSAQEQVRAEFGVMSPMRDGIQLSSDIWFPQEQGAHPAILVRTPYLKTMSFGDFNIPGLASYFARNGYVVVVQDTRGRGDSDGSFGFFFEDEKDGYDSIEWIAEQPWSNGRVCMMGVSYLGTVQWLAAKARPPHLVCIVPTAPAGRYIDELPYQGGAFMMQWALSWINGTSGRISQDNAAQVDWEKVFAHRPLLTMDEVMGRRMPLYRDFLQNHTMNDYWKRIQFTADDFRAIDLPALTVTGWFDGDQPGAMYYWYGMADHSPAKDKQFLIVGPWDHGQTFLGGATKIGEMALSPESVLDNKAVHLAFFDHYLKGTAEEYDAPRAKVFVTGSNTWREFTAYPPPEVEARRLYFHSGGRANSLTGDGTLSWDEPRQESQDAYTYDPHHPVPSDIGGATNAVDRRPVQRRDDVLVYTSEVLDAPVEIIGRVEIELHAATDARDTDFTAVITDVYPDGRAVSLGPTTGVIRARYRNGIDHTELVTPGEVEKYVLNLRDIGHMFLPGHRIRVEISSSAYPLFNPNQNTGNPVATDTEWKVAHQTIYHDRAHPSAIVLPIVPSKPIS